MTRKSTYTATDWAGYDWHDWAPFRPLSESGLPGTDTLTNEPGLYRVRHSAYDRLIYIGETGRSTRGRVGALARGTFATEMPFRDPHTAAPTLWAIREEYGPDFECSWTTPDVATDAAARKGLEAAFITRHRHTTGRSPVANFGRMLPSYEQSGYSRDGEASRGGPLSGEETASAPSEPDPPDWTAIEALTGPDWLGLDWSVPASLATAADAAPATPGVYRLWADGAAQLTYIGESQTLRSRLQRHRMNRDGELLVSYVSTPDRTTTADLLALETDLLGVHWIATETTPTDQF